MTVRTGAVGLLAALAAVVAAAGPTAAATPTPSRATPLPTSSPTTTARSATAPLVFALQDLRPRAPQPGGPLQALGTLTNTGSSTLHDLQLRVRVGGRLATRGELRQADTALPTYGNPRALRALPDVAEGASTPLDLRMAVDDLRLGADGVYPLQLEVRGLRGNGTTREQLGTLSTYLPWFGTTAVDPLRIAWLWPLADQPRRSPREVMLDDVLAGSLADGGRLARSLSAARTGESATCPAGPDPADGSPAVPGTCSSVPVTFAVDPDLVFDAVAMTRPYEVQSGTGTVAGTGTAAATAWLASLRAGAAAGDVIALPYADPDVVALTRGTADLAAEVATARSYGVTVTRDALGTDPLQGIAVPPAGRLSDAGFDALTTGSTEAVVLGDDAVSPPPASARSTPGARVALPRSSTSGSVSGLVVDRGLSDLLVPTTPQDARVAEQRWLVETAMISAELPSRGRTLVVEAPRRGAVDPAVAGAAVADTGAVPWMCPVRLGAVAAGQERCPGAAVPATSADRSVELLQPDARSAALSAEQVGQVTRVRAAASQLTGAVIKGGTEEAQALRARMQRAWLRGESSAWRDRRSDGDRLVALAAADVADLRGKVSVLTGRVVTLTSKNGRVSLAVVNELDLPVTVALRLQAPSDARLSKVQTAVLEVPARFSLPVQVDAQTLTSGRFVVKAQLLDRDGQAFGQPRELIVRSTRYGAVALAVTGLAAAVLLVAAGVRLTRRALHRTVAP